MAPSKGAPSSDKWNSECVQSLFRDYMKGNFRNYRELTAEVCKVLCQTVCEGTVIRRFKGKSTQDIGVNKNKGRIRKGWESSKSGYKMDYSEKANVTVLHVNVDDLRVRRYRKNKENATGVKWFVCIKCESSDQKPAPTARIGECGELKLKGKHSASCHPISRIQTLAESRKKEIMREIRKGSEPVAAFRKVHLEAVEADSKCRMSSLATHIGSSTKLADRMRYAKRRRCGKMADPFSLPPEN